ncbi:MAG: class I SAM-dependent methyltransferase [Hyphomonadaceae bacterium]|nr:class I SAM-dependent methyltransferase [Hyphomonadaceae bacterium]
MASINTSPGRDKFGADPAAYDRARPGYPPELFDWLRESCTLSERSDCFEIGAGTGHATLPVLALPVRSVLAIEPGSVLADWLGGAGHARLKISVHRFEDAELPANGFDFGFCATAFHWLPRMKSFAKIIAALKPGGHFAMWWNVFHDPARPDAFDAATAHLFGGLEEEPEKTASRPAFALDVNSRLGEMRAAGFADARHRLFRTTISFTPERLAALYGTFSRVRMAPAETRDRLLSEVQRIAAGEFSGTVVREVATSAFVGRRA